MRISALLLIFLYFLSGVFPSFSFGETLRVSAVVPAQASNFYTHLDSSPESTSHLSKDQVINFTLDYNSNLEYSSQLTLEATWSRAEENGAEIVSYVSGSATNAYNSTAPVIDTVNRKISWSIGSFPANTASQSVKFNLRTSSSLKTSSPITFTVTAKTAGSGSDAFVTHQKTFTYENAESSSSSNTQITPTLTPTPTPALPVKPALLSFEVVSVSDTEATLRLITSQTYSSTLRYGTSQRSLSKSINISTTTAENIISLKDLLSDTSYFVQIILSNKNGTATSEIYELKTAQKKEEITVDLTSVSLTSANLLLTDPPLHKDEKIHTVYLPIQNPYNIQLYIEKSNVVKTLDVVVRPHNIQGLTTLTQKANASELTQMVEISEGIFRGTLLTPNIPQLYDIYLRGDDISGGITEIKVAELMVHPPFRVIRDVDKKPLGDAKAELSYQDPKTKTFRSLKSQNIGIKNPDFSDQYGVVPFVLPRGTYKAIVSRIGYQTKEVLFTIGPGKDDGYPRIEMEKAFISPSQVAHYLSDTTDEIFSHFLSDFLPALGTSRRTYHLTAALSLVLFFSILLISLSHRLSKHVLHLPSYLSYLLTRHKGDNSEYSGRILDSETDKPLSQAAIYLKDADGVVLTHAITNNHGEFIFPSLPHTGALFEIIKVGYHPTIFHLRENSHRTYLLSKKTSTGFVKNLRHLFTVLLSSSFELLLLLSFLLTILIGMYVGWTDVIPFMAVSFFSLTIWTLHYKT